MRVALLVVMLIGCGREIPGENGSTHSKTDPCRSRITVLEALDGSASGIRVAARGGRAFVLYSRDEPRVQTSGLRFAAGRDGVFRTEELGGGTVDRSTRLATGDAGVVIAMGKDTLLVDLEGPSPDWHHIETNAPSVPPSCDIPPQWQMVIDQLSVWLGVDREGLPHMAWIVDPPGLLLNHPLPPPGCDRRSLFQDVWVGNTPSPDLGSLVMSFERWSLPGLEPTPLMAPVGTDPMVGVERYEAAFDADGRLHHLWARPYQTLAPDTPSVQVTFVAPDQMPESVLDGSLNLGRMELAIDPSTTPHLLYTASHPLAQAMSVSYATRAANFSAKRMWEHQAIPMPGNLVAGRIALDVNTLGRPVVALTAATRAGERALLVGTRAGGKWSMCHVDSDAVGAVAVASDGGRAYVAYFGEKTVKVATLELQ